MRSAIVVPGLLFLFLSPKPSAGPQTSDGFSVIVTATPKGWAVECEKACTWRASFDCNQICGAALVDSRGVVTLAEIRDPDPAFQFIVRRSAQGIEALRRSGTYWRSLSWDCTDVPCRARVTETGVVPIDR